jgi:hypothetical protein
MEEMLKDLPWNSIEDFWHAIRSGCADMSMMRSTIFNIAQIKHPFIIILGVSSPYLISTTILITLCIVLKCPLAILLMFPNIIYAMFAYNLRSIHNLFMWIVIILGMFFTVPAWLYIWAISIYLCKIIDSLWYAKAYKYAYEELRYNPELFAKLYLDGLIALFDVYGNFYKSNPHKNIEGDVVE